jgi:hypothetical protein
MARKRKARKEKIRDGLEIDYDLLDSDRIRMCVYYVAWGDGPSPHFHWADFMDKEGWVEGDEGDLRLMVDTPETERQWAEYHRFLRLLHYKSYADLAELASWPADDPGEFVIRRPARPISYVCGLVESKMPPGFADPDQRTVEELDEPTEYCFQHAGFSTDLCIHYAQRFTHAEAIRLCVRVMECMGMDIPGDFGDYFEPVRADIAEVLEERANRKPRLPVEIYGMVNDISREP